MCIDGSPSISCGINRYCGYINRTYVCLRGFPGGTQLLYLYNLEHKVKARKQKNILKNLQECQACNF